MFPSREKSRRWIVGGDDFDVVEILFFTIEHFQSGNVSRVPIDFKIVLIVCQLVSNL